MSWVILNGRIGYKTDSDIFFPCAEDIYALNSGLKPNASILVNANAPCDELHVRLSRLSAALHVCFIFDEPKSEIYLELVAVKGNKVQKIDFNNGTLPDSVVIDDVWYNMSGSQAVISDVFSTVGINATGRIFLSQYASIKRELMFRDISIYKDDAESHLNNHPMAISTSSAPSELIANLYPYQQQGYQWLNFIAGENCGCILGDEMGLGKTLQVIALITKRKQQGKGPALVIAPVSLLENWRREFIKFTMNIKVYVHHGSYRTGLYTDLIGYDVVVISYNTAVTDMSMLKMINWDVLAIDEAQNIKNPTAIRTKVIKELHRNVAVAVSGTPFENHLTDIWSIMDFILPGYLGNLSAFQNQFSDDEDGARRLEPLITPFMIRRRVAEVAKDLPSRVDVPQLLRLSEVEVAQYKAVRNEIIAEYNGKQATFPMLQKLRMFCTHPSLLDNMLPNDPIYGSEKYERFCELLEEIIALGEKTILFTSFNKMFEIFEKDIPRRYGIPVSSINGSTPTEERQPIIDKFTSYSGPSLLVLNPRAAGTGLNITAASRVIHYNLEWNPALEDQASARAYRRGQQLTVFVYRLFYKDTVEEIINERIEKKREMFENAIIGVDGNVANAEDIMRALTISPGGETNG